MGRGDARRVLDPNEQEESFCSRLFVIARGWFQQLIGPEMINFRLYWDHPSSSIDPAQQPSVEPSTAATPIISV